METQSPSEKSKSATENATDVRAFVPKKGKLPPKIIRLIRLHGTLTLADPASVESQIHYAKIRFNSQRGPTWKRMQPQLWELRCKVCLVGAGYFGAASLILTSIGLA